MRMTIGVRIMTISEFSAQKEQPLPGVTFMKLERLRPRYGANARAPFQRCC